MKERYPGNVVVDENGDVRHPQDIGIDPEFDQLPDEDQEAIIGAIDGRAHYVAPVEPAPEAPRQPPAEEPLEEYTQPLTAEVLAAAYRRRKVARQAFNSVQDDRERPYDELGGRSNHEDAPTADELLELIVTGAEDWMRDVHDMLRYALPELTSDAIEKMTKKDKELLALHFQGLWDRIPTSQRMIAADDKDHEFFVRRYGKNRNREELIDYIDRLENLNRYLEQSRAAWTLRQVAYDSFHSKTQRNAKYTQDRLRKGDIYVEIDKKGKKYRVKRLKDQ